MSDLRGIEIVVCFSIQENIIFRLNRKFMGLTIELVKDDASLKSYSRQTLKIHGQLCLGERNVWKMCVLKVILITRPSFMALLNSEFRAYTITVQMRTNSLLTPETRLRLLSA